jgi:hypothetical protein
MKRPDSSGRLPFGSATGDAALMAQRKPQRLAALLHEHQQLLLKIQQKKAECERLTKHIESAISVGRHEALPLFEEMMTLDRQLHELFAELLARKPQPRKTRKIVQSVYSYLQASGLLSPSWVAEGEPGEQDCGFDTVDSGPADREAEGRPKAAEEEETPPRTGESGTARRAFKQGVSASLRGLFHRLADALHPDKVQDEQEKAERTEVMKDLTQAYHAGDLARLIELERAWMLGADLGQGAAERTASDDVDRRCAQLEATNRALRLQLDEVKGELRDLRRSPQADFLAEMKRMAKGTQKEPVAAWLDALREQREEAHTLMTFVRSYRDGQIDIHEFQQGPRTSQFSPEDEEWGEMNALDALLAELGAANRASKSRRRSRRRASI